MGFRQSLLISLAGLTYTFLGAPYAPIYSAISYETLQPFCEANTPGTRQDQQLCNNVRWGPPGRDSVPIASHFEVTSKLCGSRNGWVSKDKKFSSLFDEAYFANGTTWKSLIIIGPWQSVQRSLECVMNDKEVMSRLECVVLTINRRGDT
jgi:hypothetical protein